MHAKSYGTFKPAPFSIQLPFFRCIVPLCGNLAVSVIDVKHLGLRLINCQWYEWCYFLVKLELETRNSTWQINLWRYIFTINTNTLLNIWFARGWHKIDLSPSRSTEFNYSFRAETSSRVWTWHSEGKKRKELATFCTKITNLSAFQLL